MKRTISKYARPVEFVSAKQEESPQKKPKTSGDEVASLYKQIVNVQPKKPTAQWCEICQISFLDQKVHVQGTAHMVSQQTQLPPPPDFLVLNGSNVGFNMVRSQGWQYEQGLGKHGQGKRHPIATVLKRDRLCLGHKQQGSKRVTHPPEETKRVAEKDPGKEIARKAQRESQDRVALLHYLKD